MMIEAGQRTPDQNPHWVYHLHTLDLRERVEALPGTSRTFEDGCSMTLVEEAGPQHCPSCSCPAEARGVSRIWRWTTPD